MKPQTRATDLIKLSGVGDFRCASKRKFLEGNFKFTGTRVYTVFITVIACVNSSVNYPGP